MSASPSNLDNRPALRQGAAGDVTEKPLNGHMSCPLCQGAGYIGRVTRPKGLDGKRHRRWDLHDACPKCALDAELEWLGRQPVRRKLSVLSGTSRSLRKRNERPSRLPVPIRKTGRILGVIPAPPTALERG